MADRYWVGGTATWDGTAGTKWSTTSGGAGGASVPTTSDDVYFDANSGAAVITLTSSSAMRNLNTTGFTGELKTAAILTIQVRGDITFGTGGIYADLYCFIGHVTGQTLNLDTKGKTHGFIVHNTSGAVAITVNLLSDWITKQSNPSGLSIGPNSVLNTNGYRTEVSDSTFQGTINCGNSTMVWHEPRTMADQIFMTISAGASFTGTPKFIFYCTGTNRRQIRNTSSSPRTLHDIEIQGPGTGAFWFSGGFVFNDLKIVAPRTLHFSSGTSSKVSATNWDLTGSSGNPIVITNASGTSQHYLEKLGGGFVDGEHLNVTNSNAAPASDWYAGTVSTDGGNNTGWVFSGAPKIPGLDFIRSAGMEGLYLDLPGASGNYASTPDTAANSITGDIDMRACIKPDDWTQSSWNSIASKEHPIGTRSFVWFVEATGVMSLYWYESDGTPRNAGSTAPVPFVDGEQGWVRVTLDVNNGAGGADLKFYTSTDGYTWSQLGSTVTLGFTTSIRDEAVPLFVGMQGETNGPFAGRFFYFELRDGTDGPVVAKFDPDNDADASDTSFISETGETWTIYQSGGDPAVIAGTTYRPALMPDLGLDAVAAGSVVHEAGIEARVAADFVPSSAVVYDMIMNDIPHLEFIASAAQIFDLGPQIILLPGFVDGESGVYDVAPTVVIDADFIMSTAQVFQALAYGSLPERIGLISRLTEDLVAHAKLRHDVEAFVAMFDGRATTRLNKEPTIQ